MPPHSYVDEDDMLFIGVWSSITLVVNGQETSPLSGY